MRLERFVEQPNGGFPGFDEVGGNEDLAEIQAIPRHSKRNEIYNNIEDLPENMVYDRRRFNYDKFLQYSELQIPKAFLSNFDGNDPEYLFCERGNLVRRIKLYAFRGGKMVHYFKIFEKEANEAVPDIKYFRTTNFVDERGNVDETRYCAILHVNIFFEQFKRNQIMLKSLDECQDKNDFHKHFDSKAVNNYKTHAEALNVAAVNDYMKLHKKLCPIIDVQELYDKAWTEINASSLKLPRFFNFFVHRRVIDLYFI